MIDSFRTPLAIQSPAHPRALAPALLVLLLLATAPSPAATEEPADPSVVVELTGTWLLLEEESDDVFEKLGAQRSGSGPSGGVTWQPGRNAPRGPAGGSGGRRGSRQPPPVAPGFLIDNERLEQIERGLEVLQIEFADDEGSALELRDANRQTRLLYLDGSSTGDGLGSETRTRWQGNALVVDTDGGALERTETFFVEAAAREEQVRLVLLTELRGRRMPEVEFRSVYERVRSGKRAAESSLEGSARTTVKGTESSDATDQGETTSERASLLPPVANSGSSRSRDSRADTAQRSRGIGLTDYRPGSAVIRILPPERSYGQLLTGKVLVSTLNVDPSIETVEFLLDGERFERRVLPPWEAKATLAEPAREQVISVRAFGRGDRLLGEDTLVLNRLDPPFAVRVTGAESTGDGLRVEARVSVPRDALVEGLDVYFNQQRLTTLPSQIDDPSERGPRSVERFETVVDAPARSAAPGSQDFVRVVARLDDDRELEDVLLLSEGAGDLTERLDVQLVRLQTLVVDRRGAPVTDLTAADFSVREGGRRGQTYEVDQVVPAADVDLVLGLAIDSSGSMRSIWERTRRLTEVFLEQTLRSDDQAFVVDFDQRLRLLQPPTADRSALSAALGRLTPQGGTALYDSILYSLLQFGETKGRRALVVFTDGFDSDSRADPQRAIDFGKRLGVPVYVIALDSQRAVPTRGGAANRVMAEAGARADLRLITDPTGGRLFQVVSLDQVADVYRQIEEELRSQLVVTYYSERDAMQPLEPELLVKPKGLRVRSALPVDLVE